MAGAIRRRAGLRSPAAVPARSRLAKDEVVVAYVVRDLQCDIVTGRGPIDARVLDLQ